MLTLFSKIFGIFRGADEPKGTRVARSGSPVVSTIREGGVAPWLSPSQSMSVAAAYRCVKLISDSVASLPLRYERQKDGLFVPYDSAPLSPLLTIQPNPWTSAPDFWAQAVQQLLLEGNAYIVPVRGPEGCVSRLVLCQSVGHDVMSDSYTVSDMLSGVNGEYAESEIIHLRGFSYDGKQGVSVLSHARTTLGIATTGDRQTLDRFTNGGDVRGIVGNSDTATLGYGEYQQDELAGTARDIDGEFRSGARVVSVPGDVKFTPLSMSSTDMQFLESRKFTVRDICRFFGVPPSFVFDDTSNNYKSAEMANIAFLTNTLNPLLRQIEAEMLRKLVPQSLWGKYRFRFDRAELYATDLESRVRYLSQRVATGLSTVNELRRMENLPDVEGGDKVFISANLRGIDDPATGDKKTIEGYE